MTSPEPADSHVRLDTHPKHPTAVTATLTGPHQDAALHVLLADGFEAIGRQILVMARIDNEEPYWAHKTARTLTASGIPTQITDRLRAAIDEEWTWANYPWPWCTREEICEASNDAQKIHDDIRHGRLLVHAHAQDGEATVAVATYLDSGECVYLHGHDHLRHIASTFDSLAHGFTEFAHMHGDTMRPGPAPATHAERAATEARTTPVSSPVADSSAPATTTRPKPSALCSRSRSSTNRTP